MRKIKKHKFKNKIFKIITIILLIILFLSITVYLYKNYKQNQDIYKDTNLLIGSWIYNEYNGTYVFNDDYTYTQYTNEDLTNNYCTGTYKYTYGASTNEGLKLRQDENYYYYELTLKEKECLIMNKKTSDEYIKKIYFAIYKNNNKNEIIFANAETENIFTLTKKN